MVLISLHYRWPSMDLINSFLNFTVPPAGMVMLACAWPTLFFIRTCETLYRSFSGGYYMDDKVVIVTGASSGIGEQIAYEYAKRRANLVLVARRDTRLRAISEQALLNGANHVLIVAADVVKEDDCRRFVNETINIYGRVDHLVNATSLSHTFYFDQASDTSVFPHLLDINFWGNVYPTFVALPYLQQSNGRIVVNAAVENWLPLPRMSLYAAAKAALVNFYETLKFELHGQVGITIATHGWAGSEIPRGRFILEEGSETPWKDVDREVQVSNGAIEKYAKAIVAGACKGDAYVKYPSWHDIFLLYRVFIPNVLGWTLGLLMPKPAAAPVRPMIEGPIAPVRHAPPPRHTPQGTPSRHTPESTPTRRSPESTPTRHTPEGTSPRKLLPGPGPLTFSPHMSPRKLE